MNLDAPTPPAPATASHTFQVLSGAELVRLTAELPEAAEAIAAIYDAGHVIARPVPS